MFRNNKGSTNNNKGIQSICSIKTYACTISNDKIDQNNTEYNTQYSKYWILFWYWR